MILFFVFHVENPILNEFETFVQVYEKLSSSPFDVSSLNHNFEFKSRAIIPNVSQESHFFLGKGYGISIPGVDCANGNSVTEMVWQMQSNTTPHFVSSHKSEVQIYQIKNFESTWTSLRKIW